MNMVHNLMIKDELLGAGLSNKFMLCRVSIADIISERVRHEVQSYNARSGKA